VNLPEIAASYHPASRDDLLRLAREIDERQSAEVIDVAAVAADVAIDDITSLGQAPDANPELWRAFNMAYPNVDPSSLVGRSAESMRGFVNGVKGKYFEVLVERRLNEDRVFGELVLSPGQRAALATSPTQKGWDLQVIEEDGSVAEYIQLKATARLSYIKQALENGFSVATTAEIDATSDKIIGTPLTSQELRDEAESQLGEAAESPLENALDHLAEFGIDAVPVFAPVVIVLTEGRAIHGERSPKGGSSQDGDSIGFFRSWGRVVRSGRRSHLPSGNRRSPNWMEPIFELHGSWGVSRAVERPPARHSDWLCLIGPRKPVARMRSLTR
jgi:hypothetical protein